jgi:hypothetical protein
MYEGPLVPEILNYIVKELPIEFEDPEAFLITKYINPSVLVV